MSNKKNNVTSGESRNVESNNVKRKSNSQSHASVLDLKRDRRSMNFRIVVPPNAKTGQILSVRAPNGIEGKVCIPDGTKPGETFIFEMDLTNMTPSSKNKSSSKSNTSSTLTKAKRRRQYINRKNKNDASNMWNSLESNYFLSKICSILDLDLFDLLAALAMGTSIGFSVITGFLFGVLFVTRP